MNTLSVSKSSTGEVVMKSNNKDVITILKSALEIDYPGTKIYNPTGSLILVISKSLTAEEIKLLLANHPNVGSLELTITGLKSVEDDIKLNSKEVLFGTLMDVFTKIFITKEIRFPKGVIPEDHVRLKLNLLWIKNYTIRQLKDADGDVRKIALVATKENIDKISEEYSELFESVFNRIWSEVESLAENK